MTLRATIEIVPFDDESLKRELFRLDISNIGTIRDEGFGNLICKYKATIYSRVLDYFKPKPGEEWEVIFTDIIEEHNRRDGAVALVQKATKLFEERI